MAWSRFSVVAALALALTAASPVEEQDWIQVDKISPPILAAIAAPDRPEADKALDFGRAPEQMLAFFNVAPGQQAADLYAGGGYTTELLARVVGPKGKVYSQEPVFPPEMKQIEDAWTARLKGKALANVVGIHKSLADADFVLAPPGSLDVVVINMNYHDLVIQKVDRDRVNAIVFKALKPGGIYGIIDHSAKVGAPQAESLALHRIDQAFVVAEVEKAGFRLGAASAAYRRPADDRTWSTSPRTAGERRGTSDRFMLRFVKP